MNSTLPKPQASQPKVERRHRWKKRREFDRAVRSTAVGSAGDTVVDRDTYSEIKECSCSFENADQTFAGKLRRSKSERQQSQKEVTQ